MVNIMAKPTITDKIYGENATTPIDVDYGYTSNRLRFAAAHAFDKFRAANDPSLNPRERARIKSNYYNDYNKVSDDLKVQDFNIRVANNQVNNSAGYPSTINREEFDPVYRSIPKAERPKYVARQEFEKGLKDILNPKQYDTINKTDVINYFNSAMLADEERKNSGQETYFDDIFNTDKGRDRIKSIINNINAYNSNIFHVNTIRNSLNEQDRAIYDAYNRFKSGQYINSKNGGTIYEDKAIELFNKYFNNDVEYLDIYLGDKAFDRYNKLLQDKSIVGLNSSFAVGDNHTIRVTRQNAGILPILFKGIEEAERQANLGWGTFYPGERFNIRAYDKNKKEIYPTPDPIRSYKHNIDRVSEFNYSDSVYEYADLYDDFITKYNDVANRNNLDRFKIQILGTGMSTFGRAGYYDQYEKGIIGLSEYERLSKDNDERFINTVLYSGDWYNARVYEDNGASNYELKDGTKNYEYRAAIRAAIDDYKSGAKDNLKFESVFLPGIYDADGNPAYGYKITLPRNVVKTTVGDDKHEYTDHREMQFIVTGLGNESFADDYVRDENYKALVDASYVAETKTSKLLTDGSINRQLGDVRVNGYDSDNIGIQLLGNEIVVDKQSAQQFIKNINEYNAIKDSANIYGEVKKEWLQYIQEIATNISPYTKLSAEQLTQLLIANL